MAKTSLGHRIAQPFVIFVEKYYPDAFVFVILLTGLAFALALTLLPVSAGDAVLAWGDGMPGLLAFMAQLAITLVSAHALAHTDFVHNTLKRFAALPRTEWQAYALVVFVSSMAAMIAWSLSLIVGALIARQVAVEARAKNLRVDYPLVVASAYAGMVVWHMGYSGSAPLSVATPGHPFESVIGVIPVTETLFSSGNMIAAVITIAAICVVCPLLRPPSDQAIEFTGDAVDEAVDRDGEQVNVVRRLFDHNGLLSKLFGLLLAGYLALWFYRQGFALTLDIVNWTFVAVGLILARSPVHYVRLIQNAGHTVGAILIQYPFYAGIMGLMVGTGLADLLAGWFTEIATADTLPFFAFLSGGLINLFIPSGGGQWAVQAPMFLEAAKALGTDPARIVMGIAYGDQWTNMVQPFWTLPLLAIAGLNMRQIMGYCFVLFLVSGITLGGCVLFLL